MDFRKMSLGAYADDNLGVKVFIGASYSEPGVSAFDFQHPAVTHKVKSFEAIGRPIMGDLPPGDTNESHRLTVGFRFQKSQLSYAFAGYANGDPERIEFATECVLQVARRYLIDENRVSNPIIELF